MRQQIFNEAGFRDEWENCSIKSNQKFGISIECSAHPDSYHHTEGRGQWEYGQTVRIPEKNNFTTI